MREDALSTRRFHEERISACLLSMSSDCSGWMSFKRPDSVSRFFTCEKPIKCLLHYKHHKNFSIITSKQAKIHEKQSNYDILSKSRKLVHNKKAQLKQGHTGQVPSRPGLLNLSQESHACAAEPALMASLYQPPLLTTGCPSLSSKLLSPLHPCLCVCVYE